MDRHYCVYIMTNERHSVLYTGVSGDISRRIFTHSIGEGGKFTQRYRANKLVYVETYSDIYEAIRREKQIKGGSRKRKLELINKANPKWTDLRTKIVPW